MAALVVCLVVPTTLEGRLDPLAQSGRYKTHDPEHPTFAVGST